jgi:hypothetical protein
LADPIPILDHFGQVADPARYAPLPDDWWVGVSDVIGSTAAIEAGLYKAVNLAGAATISAVSNALQSDLTLFVFSGDGARFAVPAKHALAAREALARVAMWAMRDLHLELRVGMIQVADVRAAGFDVRAAYWNASEHVRYAMFAGGGLEWADTQLKKGAIGIPPATADKEPDLTGLSCQWGPLHARQGKIVSLIIKPAQEDSSFRFQEVTAGVIALLEEAATLNPVPVEGPDVHWPSKANAWQSRIANKRRPLWLRRLRVLVATAIIWIVFKLGIPVLGFDPNRYRREITSNTDFRKFDDGLLLTVDCSSATLAQLRHALEQASKEGVVRYGLHVQDEALVTCIVPSALKADHMHFVDGADGGYALAAKQLRGG